MPLKYWWEAFEAFVYLINRHPSTTIEYMSPFFKLYNTQPQYKFFKVFGCACFPRLRPYNSFKLQFRSTKCIFLGYSAHHKGYKCLHPSGRVYIVDSVDFNEGEFSCLSLFDIHSLKSAPMPYISSVFIFTDPTFSITHNVNPTPSSSSETSASSLSDIYVSPSPHLSPASIHNVSCTSVQPSNTHSMIIRAKAGITKPRALTLTTTPPTSSPSPTAQKPVLPIASKSHKIAMADSS